MATLERIPLVSFLTHLPGRARVWTEHKAFPERSVKCWLESFNGPFKPNTLTIYKINDDRTKIELLPFNEWPLND